METPEKFCRNCNHPIGSDAKYCSQCSQKNTDGRIPVWEFLQDFFANMFNIDSKLFLTFFALFIPGKLTVEYFKGKHKSYASPVRLFLYAGITLFAIVIAKTQDVDFGVNQDYYSKKAEQVRLKKIIKDNIKRYQSEFQQDTTEYYQSDSLMRWMTKEVGSTSGNDSINLIQFFDKTKVEKIATLDFVNLSTDSILTKYNIENSFECMVVSQQIKTLKDGKGLFHFFISKLPIMIFFMMPFLALNLKVLYARRNFYFVEHLVFSFHYHTFAFIVTLILVLLGSYFHGLLLAAFIVSIFVYQFIAMKRFYKQSFFKTLFKFLLLNFVYMFLVIFFFVIAVGISFLLF